MAIPDQLGKNLKLPLIVAPMFLISGPELVTACCRSGVIGTFPSLNARSSAIYDDWLSQIAVNLRGQQAAAFGVNLIVHKTNARLDANLDVTVRRQVPLVITSLGLSHEVIAAIHAYGGLVFHDVVSRRHAEKAAEAGVDGIIAVCAGAGGHAGNISPFALVEEIRAVFNGTIILSGAMSRGSHIAAARALGADFAYMGTRFIATAEAAAAGAYKQMLCQSRAADITLTRNVTRVPANFLIPSLRAAGFDPDNLPPPEAFLAGGVTRRHGRASGPPGRVLA